MAFQMLHSSVLVFLCRSRCGSSWLIPRIEDGNNFGVSIQEETVAELRTVEGEAASYLDQISRFTDVLIVLCCTCYSQKDGTAP